MNALEKTLAKATVKIFVGNNFKGTGFFISADGYILTAFHVVKLHLLGITVQTFSGEKHIAQFDEQKSLPEQDLAVLKIQINQAQAVPLGTISSQHITDNVLSMGYPLGERADNPHLGVYGGTIFRLRDDGKIETDAVRGVGQSGGLLYLFSSRRIIGVAVEGYKPDRMIAGLAQRLDFLFQKWQDLSTLSQHAAKQWDFKMQWFNYRWWIVGGVINLILLGLFLKMGNTSINNAECIVMVSGSVGGNVKQDCK